MSVLTFTPADLWQLKYYMSIRSTHPRWNECSQYDFNNNGIIDINDLYKIRELIYEAGYTADDIINAQPAPRTPAILEDGDKAISPIIILILFVAFILLLLYLWG